MSLDSCGMLEVENTNYGGFECGGLGQSRTGHWIVAISTSFTCATLIWKGANTENKTVTDNCCTQNANVIAYFWFWMLGKKQQK